MCMHEKKIDQVLHCPTGNASTPATTHTTTPTTTTTLSCATPNAISASDNRLIAVSAVLSSLLLASLVVNVGVLFMWLNSRRRNKMSLDVVDNNHFTTSTQQLNPKGSNDDLEQSTKI